MRRLVLTAASAATAMLIPGAASADVPVVLVLSAYDPVYRNLDIEERAECRPKPCKKPADQVRGFWAWLPGAKKPEPIKRVIEIRSPGPLRTRG
jgi:hypothetical protein